MYNLTEKKIAGWIVKVFTGREVIFKEEPFSFLKSFFYNDLRCIIMHKSINI